jgi:hypothetical protein
LRSTDRETAQLKRKQLMMALSRQGSRQRELNKRLPRLRPRLRKRKREDGGRRRRRER